MAKRSGLPHLNFIYSLILIASYTKYADNKGKEVAKRKVFVERMERMKEARGIFFNIPQVIFLCFLFVSFCNVNVRQISLPCF